MIAREYVSKLTDYTAGVIPLVSFYDDASLCVETSAAFSILTSGLVIAARK
jgi:hypothetical protein